MPHNEDFQAGRASLGYIRLGVPSVFSLVILASFVIVIGVCMILWTSPFTKKMEVGGVLETLVPSVDVEANVQGVYSSFAVENGMRVTKGQLLATLERDLDLRSGGKSSDAQIHALQAAKALFVEMKTMRDERQRAAEEKANASIRSLEGEVLASQRMLESYQTEAKRLKDRFDRIKGLYQKKLATRDQLQFVKVEYQTNELRIIQIKGQIEATKIKKKSIEIDKRFRLDELSGQALDASLKEVEIKSQVEEISQSKFVQLLAPVDGIVTLLKAQPGDPAISGMKLMTIIPEQNELKATLFIPARVLSYMFDKQEIWATFVAIDPKEGGIFPARLELKGVELMEEDKLTKYQIGEPTYLVNLKLDKKTKDKILAIFPVKDDIPITSKLPIYQKMLWDWILDPIDKMKELNLKHSNSENVARAVARDKANREKTQ